MNEDLLTPGVPALSDEWVTERTQYLVEEIATPSLRQKRSYVLGGVGGGVVAVAAALVGLLGPWRLRHSPAGRPTNIGIFGSSQHAQTACASLAANLANSPGSTASATLPPVSLTDARGPYTLIVYGTTSPTLCVLGNGFSSLNENEERSARVMRHQWRRHYRRRPIDHGTRLDETMAAAASAPGEATVEYENSAVTAMVGNLAWSKAQ